MSSPERTANPNVAVQGDHDIDAILTKIKTRVEKMASPGTPYDSNLDINGMRAFVEASPVFKSSSSDAAIHAKDIFDKTLLCINTLGGIASGGASLAFGGASPCFNALTFVISAYQEYAGMFQKLVEIMSTCFDFLDRLDHYSRTNMDAKLKRVVCQQLNFFVEVCDRMLRLRGKKRFKLEAFLKIMLFQDKEVQSLLDKMKSLNRTELQLVATETRGMVSSLLKGHNEKETEKRRKELEDSLRNALRWPESSLHDPLNGQVPIAGWESTLRQLLEDKIPGTGLWLENNPLFKGWANSTSAVPILGIVGDDGTGKSHLAAHIIDHFHKQLKTSGLNTHSYVAYYFMQTDAKDPMSINGDASSPVYRSLLWQLAEIYQPLLKSAGGICQRSRTVAPPRDLWERLLIDNNELSNTNCTFYIVLDGFTEATHAKILKRFSDLTLKANSVGGQSFRILITGDSAFFTQLKNEGITNITTISLGTASLPDIEVFVKHHMDDMETLGHQSTSLQGVELDKTRAKIIEALQGSSGGNYRKIKHVLQQISMFDDEEQINNCLEQSRNESVDQISEIVQKLNESSTPTEIRDINEMLVWVIDGRTWLTPLQMEGALALRSFIPAADNALQSSKPTESGATVVRSLESRIHHERYPLFEIQKGYNDADVRFRHGTSIDVAKQRILAMVPTAGKDDESTNYELTEVKLVKHYLRTVCPEDIYKKFGFDEFFDQKIKRKADFICYDTKIAELALSLRCLTLLVKKRGPKIQLLHSYAAEYLHEHLDAARHDCDLPSNESRLEDLSSTEKHVRSQVGRFLVELFTKPHAIDSLFGIGYSFDNEWDSFLAQRSAPPSWRFWVMSNTGAELLTKFFADQTVQDLVRDTDLVKALTGSPKSGKYLAILRPSVNLAVEHLFKEDATGHAIENAFSFLMAAEAGTRPKQKKQAESSSSNFWQPDLKQVKSVEDWALKVASAKGDSSIWDANMAAVLFRFSLDDDGSITKEDASTRARQALVLHKGSWQASYTLARIVESDKEAVAILRDIINRLSRDTTWRNASSNNKSILAEMYLELGSRLWSVQDSPKRLEATAAYLNSVEGNMNHHQCYLDMISRYAREDLWEEIMSLMEKILEVSVSPNGTQTAKSAIQGVFEDVTLSGILGRASETIGQRDLLHRLYEHGLKQNTSYRSNVRIGMNYGAILESQGSQGDEVLKVWERVWQPEPPMDLIYVNSRMLVSITTKVMPIYTAGALAKTISSSRRPHEAGKCAPMSPFAEKIESLYERFRRASRNLATPQVLHFTRYFFRCREFERAKDSISALLSQSLDMMLNDDTTDDFTCFWQLQAIFHTFEDVQNATAAMNMAAVAMKRQNADKRANWKKQMEQFNSRQKTNDGDELKQTVFDEQQEPEQPIERPTVICDGCGFWWKFPSGLWTCSDDCGQVNFDDDCYQRLKKGTLERRICDKSHTLCFISKQDGNVFSPPDGKVKVGRRFISLEKWKDEIIVEYSTSPKGRGRT